MFERITTAIQLVSVFCCCSPPPPPLFSGVLPTYKDFFCFKSKPLNKFNTTCLSISFVKLKWLLPVHVDRPAERNKACFSVAPCCCSRMRT